MRSAASRTAIAIVVPCLVLVPSLSATAAGPAPTFRGARFSFTASSVPAAASGAGILDETAPLGGKGAIRVSLRRTSGARATITASVGKWRLTTHGASATLRLTLEVQETTDPAVCPAAARGSAVLADAGRSDSVRITFGGRCKLFIRSWPTSGDGESTARVSIGLLPRR